MTSHDRNIGCCSADSTQTEGETSCATPGSLHAGARPQPEIDHPKLEDLIPIAAVIASGCEPCAERMVRRALEAGSPRRHVLRTIAIVADLRERECFRTNVGPEVVERMKGPVARARKTADDARVDHS